MCNAVDLRRCPGPALFYHNAIVASIRLFSRDASAYIHIICIVIAGLCKVFTLASTQNQCNHTTKEMDVLPIE